MAAALAPQILSAADRCDRCGARAYLRVTLPGGGELLFCGHHGRAHEDALIAADARIEDQTQRLSSDAATPDDGQV